MKNFSKILLVLLAAASMASCQKDLCYDHDHGETRQPLTVRFDWSGVAEAANPSQMSLMVFAGASQPVEFQFAGMSGGALSLPAGDYQFTGFNSDTEMGTRGMSWGDFEIYSQQTELNAFSRMFATTRYVPKTRGTEEQPVIYEPDALWTSAAAGVEMSEQTYGQTVTMPMEEATRLYSFTITGIDNFDYITEVAGTLSGMSGSWIPALHRPSDDEVIIPFSVTKSADGTPAITGTVRTFGHCPGRGADNHNDHMLVVYAEVKSGQKYYYTFDVTEAMHDANHVIDGSGHTEVPIEISGLPIPKPIVNGSGFQPDVTVWNEVNIGIDL